MDCISTRLHGCDDWEEWCKEAQELFEAMGIWDIVTGCVDLIVAILSVPKPYGYPRPCHEDEEGSTSGDMIIDVMAGEPQSRAKPAHLVRKPALTVS